jgi:hypothetical protein
MSKIKKMIKKVIITLLLFIIVIILLVPRGIYSKESFISSPESTTNTTSESIYRNVFTNSPAASAVSTYDAQINDLSFSRTNDDSKYELIMKRCYQYPNLTFEQIASGTGEGAKTLGQGSCFKQTFTMSTAEFINVKLQIIQKIQNAYDSELNGGISAPIHGPIYVQIFQVPYYITNDANSSTISLQPFNIASYGFKAQYQDGNQPINYYCIIYYGRYSPDGILVNDDNFTKYSLPYFDQNYASGEQQCYMRGATKNGMGEGINVYAGCSSSTGTTTGGYPAKCTGPIAGNNLLQKDPNDKLTTLSSYGILYLVNPTAPSIKSFFFSGVTSYPTPWKYIGSAVSAGGIYNPVRLSSPTEVECIRDPNTEECYGNTITNLNKAATTFNLNDKNNNIAIPMNFEVIPAIPCSSINGQPICNLLKN